jgi:hypothetical protein
MPAQTNILPESLGYLPAFFRTTVEPGDVAAHHPVRWVLQFFDTNLHMAERMVEKSRMLFDPEEVSLLPGKVVPPTFAVGDIIDLPSFASKLRRSDPVSHYLWSHFPESMREKLSHDEALAADTGLLQGALVRELNHIILHRAIYTEDRFRAVKISEKTRTFLKTQPQDLALVRLNRLLLEDAYPLEIAAMPEVSWLNLQDSELDYLHYLASWVALSLDQKWFTNPEEKAGTGVTQNLSQRYATARSAIKRAAVLYRERGTPNGLKEVLKLFYDLEAEIIERSWPQAMEIGVCSSIGLDCWLLDGPDLDYQFTVVISAPAPDIGSLIKSQLLGQSRGQQIEWLTGGDDQAAEGTTATEASPKPEDIRFAFNKLRNLIDQDKPAHTSYYLALKCSEPQARQPRLPPLEVEVHSEIGGFWIK